MFDIKKLKENPNVNIFSRKTEILNVLKGFANQKRSLIAIPMPFNNEYSTNIIGVSNDIIRLDSLMPKDGNLKFIESYYVKINFKFNNNEHYFISKLFDYKQRKDKDYTAFDIYMPAEILSLEKRKFFRVEPSLDSPVRIMFFYNGTYFNTKVYDISGEGLSFLLDFPLEKLSVIEAVRVEFPYGTPSISVRLEVRNAERTDTLKYKIGCLIINIKNRDQDKIFKYMFKRQREIVSGK